MKEKKQENRKEVVVTARLTEELHAEARARMFPNRDTFQSVCVRAIEEYVRKAGGDVVPSARKLSIPRISRHYAPIAALHDNLIQKKSDGILTTPSVTTLHELTIYLRDTRAILDKIDRDIVNIATGDQVATLGSDMYPTENANEGESAKESAIGINGINGIRAGEREPDSIEQAHELINHAGRTRERAGENLGNDLHAPGRRPTTRKKAG